MNTINFRFDMPFGKSLCALATLVAIAGCSKKSSQAAGVIAANDTAAMRTGTSVAAEGIGVQVTRTDDKSVTRSTRYELTDSNFAHFIAANDSLAALEGRDAAAKTYLSQNLTDAGAKTLNAGKQYLDANPNVSTAINNAGISTEDYFVQGVAIAAAERFMTNPKSAPPEPALAKNATFLQSHQTDLAHIKALTKGQMDVVVTPK